MGKIRTGRGESPVEIKDLVYKKDRGETGEEIYKQKLEVTHIKHVHAGWLDSNRDVLNLLGPRSFPSQLTLEYIVKSPLRLLKL